VTAWDSRDEAGEFAAAARDVAAARREDRPERRLDVVSRVQDGIPLVVVTDRPAGLDASRIDASVSIEPSGT
jgi:hypothetical protein